jgi:hypothetical protein
MPRPMSTEGVNAAIARIERALGRIEAASARIAAAQAPDQPSDLAQRHASLKRETEAALADLDQIIAKIGGGAR